MRLLLSALVVVQLLNTGTAQVLPRAAEPAQVVLPDYGAEVRAFDVPENRPVSWWPHVVNAAWGGGRGGPERRDGWLQKNWILVDYLDRSADYTSNEYLTHRGIWYEVYGSNEYQETIHFNEKGARELLWENGIARDMLGRRVLSEHYNTKVPSWAARVGWDAYIVCNNAPRWWSVINYDMLTSPLLGHAVSQDNIGGPLSRIGAGSHGRYCDYCNAKFFHHLAVTDRLPEFREKHENIRDYVEANLMDVVRQLHPYTKLRWSGKATELQAELCVPPVMSEYQKFLYLSHIHNFIRYYRDLKLIGDRSGRQYDVHGNQGGSTIGPNPYQVALSDFVDTVWFESSGLSGYDMFKYGWNNSNGALRYKMGQAMTRGRKPFMSMTAFQKHTLDIVEHEMAEACSGAGVLFVNQEHFQKEPQLLEKVTEYFRFRHQHRGLFAYSARRPFARVALAYSIPTMMYRSYQYTTDAPPSLALPGIARAMEEGHVPFEVVIFNHPEIHADRATLEKLKQYRLIILPALECLTNDQIDLFTEYLKAGGTLGLIGESGIRNQDNLPRDEPPGAAWREAGRVIDILPGTNFLPARTKEGDRTRQLTDTAIESLRKALADDTILSGELPRKLWVNTWQHGDRFTSVHLVNYNIDFESGSATPTEPLDLTVDLPSGMAIEEAVWLEPGGSSQSLPMSVEGRKATVTIPSIRVYGVLMIGAKGLDRKPSALLQGYALASRATLATGERPASIQRPTVFTSTADEALAYEESAREALQQAQANSDKSYLQRLDSMVNETWRDRGIADNAVRAFDFGGKKDQDPWKAVGPESDYKADVGYGWLPSTDQSVPTPEETYYAMAGRYGEKYATRLASGSIPFWPYKELAPVQLRTNLISGTSRQFRVDLPPGEYSVRVVTTNSSWTNRNFLVSGMVRVNGQTCLLDAVHDKGTQVAREFSIECPDGKLEFEFGGPTGWAVSALTIEPAGAALDDTKALHGLQTWHVSPRYANSDWYPVTQVACPPERRLRSLPDADWTRLEASPGIPLVDLGSAQEAEVGDVVYAATVIDSPADRSVTLHFGASSQAQLWLDRKPLGYVPNVKGVQADEFVAPLRLKKGKNVLVVKLERFWERRWMFYAGLSTSAPGAENR